MATCTAGPPNAMHPSLAMTTTTSRRAWRVSRGSVVTSAWKTFRTRGSHRRRRGRSVREVPGLALEDVIPLHLADVTFPEWHPLRGQAGEIFAFAVRHPSGVILYETGIGQGNEMLDDYYQVVHHPIEAALEAHGHRVAEVRLVVNSHLHFDHCGNNMTFAGVPIFVQSVEYEAAREPNYTIPEWVDFEGADYAVLDGDARVASGVRVISTPGHSPGHQSLLVDTKDGAVALAGQAIYSKSE